MSKWRKDLKEYHVDQMELVALLSGLALFPITLLPKDRLQGHREQARV
jgi:hypothetical protein